MSQATNSTSTYFFTRPDAIALYDTLATVVEPGCNQMRAAMQALVQRTLNNDVRFVLDLGVGTGSLIDPICAVAPNITYIGLDISADALYVASATARKRRLADRFLPIQADIREIGGLTLMAATGSRASIEGRCTVISAMTLHHMTPSDKQNVYAVCSRLCASSGSFINGDLYLFGNSVLNELDVERHVAGMIERFDAVYKEASPLRTDRLMSLKAQWVDHYRQHSCLLPIADELTLLHAAGFAVADCVEQNGQRAIVYGSRSR